MKFKLVKNGKVVLIGSYPKGLTTLGDEFTLINKEDNMILKLREIRKYPLYTYLIETLETGIEECENMDGVWGEIGPDILRKDLTTFENRLKSIDEFLRSLDYLELVKIYDLPDDEILKDTYLIRALLKFELE